MFIVRPPGIVYEGETDEQAAERDRLIAEHNAAVRQELAKCQYDPVGEYRKWYRKKFGVEYDRPR